MNSLWGLKVGEKIWSDYFNRLITIYAINSDNNWYFELDGKVLKAQTPLSYFADKINEENEGD